MLDLVVGGKSASPDHKTKTSICNLSNTNKHMDSRDAIQRFWTGQESPELEKRWSAQFPTIHLMASSWFNFHLLEKI